MSIATDGDKVIVRLGVIREGEEIEIALMTFEPLDADSPLPSVSGERVENFQVKPADIADMPAMFISLVEPVLDCARAKARVQDARGRVDNKGVFHVVPKVDIQILQNLRRGETVRLAIEPQANGEVIVAGKASRSCRVGIYAEDSGIPEEARMSRPSLCIILIAKPLPSPREQLRYYHPHAASYHSFALSNKEITSI